VGDIDLQIPKLRSGSFLPSILEPRCRVDQALYAVVMEAYVGSPEKARSTAAQVVSRLISGRLCAARRGAMLSSGPRSPSQ